MSPIARVVPKGPPPAGGLVAGPGPGPCAPPPGGNDEYILLWQGTPGSDNFFSPNFCVGMPVGPNARLLVFKVLPPAGAAVNVEIWERFRLDYGEDVGQHLRDFTDPTLGAIPTDGGRRAVQPDDRFAGIGYEQGEAKYGEVEDYVVVIRRPVTKKVDRLYLAGPIPNRMPTGTEASITARVQLGAAGRPGQEVVVTQLRGSVTFLNGIISPDGAMTTLFTDGNGSAEIALVTDAPGQVLLMATVPGTSLSAFSFFVAE